MIRKTSSIPAKVAERYDHVQQVGGNGNMVADMGVVQILEEGKAFELGKIMHLSLIHI